MITYVMYVDTNGEIRIVKTPKGVNPPEGMDDETGFEVVYYTSPITDINDFIETRYWTSDRGFIVRAERPNEFAEWNGTDWTFDFNDLLGQIRMYRNIELTNTDFTQIPDSPFTQSQRTAWRTYRQALRDFPGTVPTTITNINQVVWPTPPAS